MLFNTRGDMKCMFLDKFFPASRTETIRKEICGIRQHSRETPLEYSERFNKLCATCPHHQISEQLLIQYFYEGLTMMDQSMIDIASGGALMDKMLVAARQLISNMASNTQQFGIRGADQPRMVNEIDTVNNLRLENQLTKLTSLGRQLAVGQHQPSIATIVCGICTFIEHPIDMCPILQETKSDHPESIGAIGGYQYGKQPYQTTILARAKARALCGLAIRIRPEFTPKSKWLSTVEFAILGTIFPTSTVIENATSRKLTLEDLMKQLATSNLELRKVRSTIASTNNSSNSISHSDNNVSTANNTNFSSYSSSNSNTYSILDLTNSNKPELMKNQDSTLKELATPDVPKFHGLAGEDPHKHLKEFHLGILEDYIKMKAFPFSLDGAVKDWLYLQPTLFNTWGDMKCIFLEKFFPASKTATIREYWERFNKLCATCPYHQIGLMMLDCSMIDATSGGALMDKTPTTVRHLISNMFGTRRAITSRAVNEVGAVDNLRLENQLTELTSSVRQLVVNQHQQIPLVKIYGICTSVEHPTDMCPILQDRDIQCHHSNNSSNNANIEQLTIYGGMDEISTEHERYSA
ncbi:hypothetical protein CR513_22453, partial [Mucuna pruriens]